MDHAKGYFAAKEINSRLGLASANDLWEWINRDDLRLAPQSWGLKAGENLVFRGQADAAHGLSSKLYRDLREALLQQGITDFGENDLAGAEQSVIELAREEGVGRNMTDGELLAVLQHHGVATRLLDVSKSLREALFFAVDDHADLDGRLFMFFLHRSDATSAYVSLGATPRVPWSDVVVGTRYATGDWTKTVALVDEASLDPRMRAQHGAFLVGGLNRRYRGDRWAYGSQEPATKDFNSISTLRVKFLKSTTAHPNNGYTASGWTVRIKAEWKSALRKRLSEVEPPITYDSMYPPVSELRRLARRELRGWRPGVPAARER